MTSKNQLKILFVEDLPSDVDLAVLELRKEGIKFDYLRVDTRIDFIKGLQEFKPDIVISDYSMPTYDGMKALTDTKEFSPLLPFILCTGSINEETAVDCIKAGAKDYVIKEHLTRLPFALKEALEQFRIQIEKRAAEELLKENEAKLQSIFRAAPVGIGLVVNSVFMEVNDTFCKMTGYDRKELIGKTAEMIYAVDAQNESAGIVIYKHIAEKGTGSIETRFRCKDGRILNIFLNSSRLDKDDPKKGISFIAMDITEKKNAEAALHESEERFRILYNDAIVGLYRTNSKGEILMANRVLVNMLGFQSFKELSSRNLKETGYGPSYQRQQFIDLIEKAGEVKNLEAIWICRDGKEIFIRESAKAIYGSDGKILYYDGTVEDITDRKIAEKALRESEEIFRHFMEHSPIYVFFKDENIRAIRLSKNYETMLGKPLAELLGKNMDELFPSVFAKKIVEDDIRVLKEGKVITIDEELDGRFYATIKFPIIIDGKPSYLAGYTIDITDRKLADEALKQSEMRFEQISANFGEWIWEVDKNGLYTYSSPVVKEILGYDPEELVNKKYFYDFFIPEIREQFKQAALEAFVRKENFRNFINSNLHKDGREVILSTSGLPLVDQRGELIGYRGVDTDITERKKAEDELKQSHAFNESLLKTIPFGMDIVDEEGTILFQSDNFKRLFGEEAIGMKCWELYRDDKKQCSDCPLTRDIIIGETEAYESHGVLGNRIFEIIHTGMMYMGEKAMLEIFQDITDRKESEAELISAKEKAEESDHLKTAFLHNISHEIRTPMNAIVGFSALLGESELDITTQQSYIETIMQSSSHLLAIINDIVDISNIEANLVKISSKEINVNLTLISLCSQFSPKAEQKKIELKCKSELPDNEALIVTDSTKLIQIVTNLINNALKFTEEGAVNLSVKITGRFLQFSVSDTGIGIPEDSHDKIFERFYQIQNSITRIYEGTGLGLAISKAYVELMGGKIWVSSEPGKGTTFTFTVPYEKQIIAEKSAAEKSGPESSAFKRKRKILIAEDIDSNFKLLTYFLRGTNTEIIRAVNGRIAVEKCLGEKDIDLILMDVKMPEMDGYTAVKLIREAKITIPIIAQTAYADNKAKALEIGCNGFLSKPFDKNKLLNTVKEYVKID